MNMRIQLKSQERKKLFGRVLGKYSLSEVALQIGASRRTLGDWQRGIFTIPEASFRKLLHIAGYDEKVFSPKKYSDHWHNKDAARKGGQIIFKRYGNIGTPEGRKKGGLASQATHKKNKTAFFNLKKIQKPKYSRKLAELLGILFGDGHLSNYQIIVTTNSVTDKEHALFVQKLFEQIFHDRPSIMARKDERSVVITLSSRAASDYLHEFGMPRGNKIKENFFIPDWIKDDRGYQKAFMRGLFDTDGCIYADKHLINGHKYISLGWAITSYSSRLRKDIAAILTGMGYAPTNRGAQTSVFLRRREEIKKYFKEVGSSNPKHLKRYRKFLEEYQSGHTGAVSKTAVRASDT